MHACIVSFFRLTHICFEFYYFYFFSREIAYVKKKKEENWISFLLRGWFEAFSKPVPPSYIGYKHFTTHYTVPKTEGSKGLLGIVVMPDNTTRGDEDIII